MNSERDDILLSHFTGEQSCVNVLWDEALEEERKMELQKAVTKTKGGK